MAYTLSLLEQIADGLARQFGPDCEIVIHDLKRHDLEHSVVHINNGHITNRREGDGPSKVVLETLHRSGFTERPSWLSYPHIKTVRS